MDLSNLTLADVKQTAEDIVSTKPDDFVYLAPTDEGKCVYVHEDQPSCLVGQILFRKGVPLPLMETWDDRHDSLITDILSADAGDINPDVLVFLNILQNFQDSGNTWTEALDKANHNVK